jgi:hypothetical protein
MAFYTSRQSVFWTNFGAWKLSLLPRHAHFPPAKTDVAAPDPSGVHITQVLTPPTWLAPRRRRYTLTPTRLRWDHFNLTYRCLLALGLGGLCQAQTQPSTLTLTPGSSPFPETS